MGVGTQVLKKRLVVALVLGCMHMGIINSLRLRAGHLHYPHDALQSHYVLWVPPLNIGSSELSEFLELSELPKLSKLDVLTGGLSLGS